MLGLYVSELSEYSRSVARLIAKHRPAWLDYAKAVEVKGSPHKSLEIRIPNEAPIGSIIILTEQDELTVYVSDYFHTHFWGYSEVEQDESFQEFLTFINSVISEESVIYWVLHDEKWIQSGAMDTIEFDLLNDVPSGSHRLFTRSWGGTCDRERTIDFDIFKKLW